MNLNLPRRRGILSNMGTSPFAPGEQNTYGDDLSDTGAILDRLQTLPGVMPQTEQPLQQPLPTPPPKPADTNPWSKANRSRTLLGIGQAFLSSPDFFEGLGNAAGSLGNRADALKAAANPKTEIGGPGGQFEIVTNPDGSREVRTIPEFAAYNQAEREAKAAPKPLTPKEAVELRARALYAVSQLPPEQREAAYADIMNNPARYGGVDTSVLPPGYDENLVRVLGGLGTSVTQQLTDADRDRAFEHRETVDKERLKQGETRLQQGQRRLDKPPASVTSRKSNVPSGFILD